MSTLNSMHWWFYSKQTQTEYWCEPFSLLIDCSLGQNKSTASFANSDLLPASHRQTCPKSLRAIFHWRNSSRNPFWKCFLFLLFLFFYVISFFFFFFFHHFRPFFYFIVIYNFQVSELLYSSLSVCTHALSSTNVPKFFYNDEWVWTILKTLIQVLFIYLFYISYLNKCQRNK